MTTNIEKLLFGKDFMKKTETKFKARFKGKINIINKSGYFIPMSAINKSFRTVDAEININSSKNNKNATKSVKKIRPANIQIIQEKNSFTIDYSNNVTPKYKSHKKKLNPTKELYKLIIDKSVNNNTKNIKQTFTNKQKNYQTPTPELKHISLNILNRNKSQKQISKSVMLSPKISSHKKLPPLNPLSKQRNSTKPMHDRSFIVNGKLPPKFLDHKMYEKIESLLDFKNFQDSTNNQRYPYYGLSIESCSENIMPAKITPRKNTRNQKIQTQINESDTRTRAIQTHIRESKNQIGVLQNIRRKCVDAISEKILKKTIIRLPTIHKYTQN